MSAVAVFLQQGTRVDTSPSLLNLFDLLLRDHEVHCFADGFDLRGTPVLPRSHFKLHSLRGRTSYYRAWMSARWLHRTGQIGNIICVDPRAFWTCRKFLPSAKPVFYSFELYEAADSSSGYTPTVEEETRQHIRTIRGLIIQSEERESIFRADYDLPKTTPTLLLPVTYRGPAVGAKLRLLHERYSMPEETRVALHLGAIDSWCWCIELARTFSKVPGWVLLFHGYARPGYLRDLKSIISVEKIENVVISEAFHQDLEGFYPLVQSSDLGLAWYENTSPNVRTSGTSSGKISAYLKFGLPVVTKRYTGTVRALESRGCGVCVDTIQDIPQAIKRIEDGYSHYSQNALREFERVYRFERYESSILEFLQSARGPIT